MRCEFKSIGMFYPATINIREFTSATTRDLIDMIVESLGINT
ncbi:hypothetical protein JCM19239_4387 [Vibrio variabilis]|uniref:Uncharacterized protein n=1 Tax=Vibrio variabilis TaxID=990271 RepID=A0ABQ0JE57_9VIBR|nr:hypothetical protein JCM19239_4387 [Vibrio variabilis]